MPTVNVDGAQASISAANGNYSFVVATENFTSTIVGFGAGDQLSFANNSMISVSNTNYSDGNVTLTYASGGRVSNVVIAGLTALQDTAINFVADLNAVFGAGTINLGSSSTISAGSSTVNEGSNATFTLTTTNVASGTVMPYTISGTVNSADIVGGALFGNATVGSDGKAMITVALATDNLTEGSETLTMSAAGQTASTTIIDSSIGSFGPKYTFAAKDFLLHEGETFSVELLTTNVAVGASLSYTITGISNPDILGVPLTGTVTVDANGLATLPITVAADSLTEPNEKFSVLVAGQAQNFMITDTSWSFATMGQTTVQQCVSGLYAAFYDRAADFNGMNYWINIVGGRQSTPGLTYEAAATTAIAKEDAAYLGKLFASSQSAYFNQLYSNKANPDFINALYINLAGQPAETSSNAVAYWQNIIKKYSDVGYSTLDARGHMVGEFVHDLIETNPLEWLSRLTPAENEMVAFRANVIHNKVTTSLAYVGAASQAEGTVLNAAVVGDAAFYAQVRALSGVSNNVSAVYEQIDEISAVLRSQNLSEIQPVGFISYKTSLGPLEGSVL